MAKFSILAVLGALIPGLSACTTPPEGITPVSNFDAERYLGTWHEIARLDHRFERGLVAVSATYTRNPDGSLKVVNRGFKPKTCAWSEAVGRAKFTAEPTKGQLAVSFFGPFYGGYNIIALDKDYQYALVCGPDRDYLWILARTPTLPEAVKKQMLDIAVRQGFAVEKLLWINQSY